METVVVVIGQESQNVTGHLKDSDVRVSIAINPDPNSEMSNSIACGVRQFPNRLKAVLITPADHPAVPARGSRTALIDEWQQGATLVMPTCNERGGHPVLIDLSFRDELLNLDDAAG